MNKGMVKPRKALDNDEDQVSRTPRARRTEAAKGGAIEQTDMEDTTEGVVPISKSRPAEADDLETTDMATINRITPKRGMVKK